mgnify:CR=1 FL=1
MALDSNKIADNFIDQIKQGSSPIPKQAKRGVGVKLW